MNDGPKLHQPEDCDGVCSIPKDKAIRLQTIQALENLSRAMDAVRAMVSDGLQIVLDTKAAIEAGAPIARTAGFSLAAFALAFTHDAGQVSITAAEIASSLGWYRRFVQ